MVMRWVVGEPGNMTDHSHASDCNLKKEKMKVLMFPRSLVSPLVTDGGKCMKSGRFVYNKSGQ